MDDYASEILMSLSEATRIMGGTGGIHEAIRRRRRLYKFDHYDTKPAPNEVRYADPTYTNVVDLAVGILLSNPMTWRAYSWSAGRSKVEKTVDRAEKFLAGVVEINDLRNEYSTLYEIVLNFVRDGMAVLYTPWDDVLHRRFHQTVPLPDDNGEMLEEIVFLEPPLVVKRIDPLNVYLVPGGPKRWNKVMVVDDVSVADVEAEFGIQIQRHVGMSDNDKRATKGRLVNYWEWASIQPAPPLPTPENPNPEPAPPMDVVRNCVLFEDEVLKPLEIKTGYDDLPFTIGFFKPVGMKDSNEWGHSIIDPMESSVQMQERSVNRRQRQIDVYSSLPMVFRTIGGRVLSIDQGLGQHVQLEVGEDVGFPTWPGNAPDVQYQIEFFRSKVQQSGFSDVMFGSGASQTSGYGLSLLGDQNRIRLTQVVEHLQLFWTAAATRMLSLSANIARGALIRVYGLYRGREFSDQVRGQDLEGLKVKARIRPEFPQERARNHAMATQAAGFLSRATIQQDYLGVEQPTDEEDRRMAESISSHPIMVQYAIMEALRVMADEDQDQNAAALLNLMKTQLQGNQPGRPTEPRAPEQLIGLQSPTGEAPPQAVGGMPPGQSEMEQMAAMAGAAPNMQGGVA